MQTPSGSPEVKGGWERNHLLEENRSPEKDHGPEGNCGLEGNCRPEGNCQRSQSEAEHLWLQLHSVRLQSSCVSIL